MPARDPAEHGTAALEQPPPHQERDRKEMVTCNGMRDLAYQDLLTVLLLATNISISLKASTSVSSDRAP